MVCCYSLNFPYKLQGLFIEQITTDRQKKKTAPGGGTPEAVRRNKPHLKLMFQPPLNIISHWGWLCYTHFL